MHSYKNYTNFYISYSRAMLHKLLYNVNSEFVSVFGIIPIEYTPTYTSKDLSFHFFFFSFNLGLWFLQLIIFMAASYRRFWACENNYRFSNSKKKIPSEREEYVLSKQTYALEILSAFR